MKHVLATIHTWRGFWWDSIQTKPKVESADYTAYTWRRNLGFQKGNFEANQVIGVGDRSADKVVASLFDGKFEQGHEPITMTWENDPPPHQRFWKMKLVLVTVGHIEVGVHVLLRLLESPLGGIESWLRYFGSNFPLLPTAFVLIPGSKEREWRGKHHVHDSELASASFHCITW